jgi:hypothetical protein
LNLGNLLLAADRVFVLDLDQARLQQPIRLQSRCSNLLRLYRSLAKETGRPEPLSLRDRRWFLRAYARDNPAIFEPLWGSLASRWPYAAARRRLVTWFRAPRSRPDPASSAGPCRR